MRGIGRGALQGRDKHRLDLPVGDRARPTRASLVTQPVEAALKEPLTPLTHCLRPHPLLRGDLGIGFTCGAAQHNPRPLCQRL